MSGSMTAMRRDVLSPAERRVVAALCERGETNAQIAARLFCAEATVKFHLTSALSLSGAANRTALALWWVRAGQYVGVDEGATLSQTT